MHISMNSKLKLKRWSKQGFTLIELAIVIIIIGILAGISSVQYVGNVRAAVITEAISGIQAIVRAEIIYFVKHGKWCVINEYRRKNLNTNDGSKNALLFKEKLGVDVQSNYWHYRVDGSENYAVYVVAYANKVTNPAMYPGDISFRIPRTDGKYPGAKWPGSFGYGCWRPWIKADELPYPRRWGYR